MVTKFTEAAIELYKTIKVQDITTLILPAKDDSPDKDPSGKLRPPAFLDITRNWRIETQDKKRL